MIDLSEQGLERLEKELSDFVREARQTPNGPEEPWAAEEFAEPALALIFALRQARDDLQEARELLGEAFYETEGLLSGRIGAFLFRTAPRESQG